MADGPSTFPAATTWRARLAWHEPGTSKEEKWLIRKLDLFILSYTSLTFFIKFLVRLHSMFGALGPKLTRSLSGVAGSNKHQQRLRFRYGDGA